MCIYITSVRDHLTAVIASSSLSPMVPAPVYIYMYIIYIYIYLRTYVTTFGAATASISTPAVPASSLGPRTERNK